MSDEEGVTVDEVPGETPPETPPAQHKGARRGLPSGFATLRDILAFVAGLIIVGHEVFLKEKVEPTAIAVGLSMLGLPIVFGADERKKPKD